MTAGTPQLKLPSLGIIAGAVLAFLYLPIATLIALSFNANDVSTIWSGFTLKWYGVAVSNDEMLRAVKNSLLVATLAMGLATAIATAAALGLHRMSNRQRDAIEGLLGLPLLVPEIVTAVALLLLFVSSGFALGLTTIVLAHTVFCIPFAFYPIRSRLASLDPALIEAATDLYATPGQRFYRIELPLLLPGIFAGALLAFISSLGDFVITYFVAGPGATTLPVYIYGMIRIGITPEVNALSALLLLASVAAISASFVLGNQTSKSNPGGLPK